MDDKWRIDTYIQPGDKFENMEKNGQRKVNKDVSKGNKDTQMETKQKTTQPCRETNAETKRRQRPKEMDTPNKIQEASEGRQRRTQPPMLGDE